MNFVLGDSDEGSFVFSPGRYDFVNEAPEVQVGVGRGKGEVLFRVITVPFST